MDYKYKQIMEIESLFIDYDKTEIHTETSIYEVETDELMDNLTAILGNQIDYDNYHFYELTNHRTWIDKFDNEESEFEKIKIELSVISEALLMSKTIKEIETF